MNTQHGYVRALVIALPLVAASFAARAAEAGQAPSQQPQPPLLLERIETKFVIAPDVKLTTVDDDFATLAGGYGGWLMDGTLLVGGGGYWLANRADDFKMAYGGLVVEWLTRRDRAVGVSVRGLVGGGSATLSTPLADLIGGRSGSAFGRRAVVFGRGLSPDTRVLFDEGFFIAEPQVNLLWHLTRWLSVNGGVGYRLIGGAGEFDDRLRGVSGSVGIRFGG